MASLPKNDDENQILVMDKFYARVLMLNRPRKLNAVSFQMASQLLELFHQYEGNSNVKLIVMKANGRAFCAGGDVAAVVQYAREGNWKYGANFFGTEFRLNYLIATYSKPQISILDGIIMGGGAGLSIHGRFRVATENSVFAMPETALGLFPDIGASYFLSRLPGFFGEYVGLTGAKLDAAEMLACGLATHFVSSSKLSSLEEELCKLDSSDPASVSAIIDKYSEQPLLKENCAYQRLDVINKCFSRKTIEEILSYLEAEVASKTDEWISATILSLKQASPTSLKIFLRSEEDPLECKVHFRGSTAAEYFKEKAPWLFRKLAAEQKIREGRLQGVGQCLVREYRMVCHILRGDFSKDFFEGCRAILLDKDRNPKWEPSKLELLSDSIVDQYFSKLDVKGWEDLKLPERFNNLPAYAMSKL